MATGKHALLKWCQLRTKSYQQVDITNFTSSWKSGLGFCALLHSYVPHLVEIERLSARQSEKNLKLAFRLAHKWLGVPSTYLALAVFTGLPWPNQAPAFPPERCV